MEVEDNCFLTLENKKIFHLSKHHVQSGKILLILRFMEKAVKYKFVV